MNINPLAVLVMSNRLLLVLFIAWVGFAIVCAWFADRRGRPVALWALLGFLFAWLALIVLLVLPNLKKRPDA